MKNSVVIIISSMLLLGAIIFAIIFNSELDISISDFADTERIRFDDSRFGLFDTLIIFSGYAENEEAFMVYADTVFGIMETLHKYFDAFNEYDGINNIYTINQVAGREPVVVSSYIINLLLAAREGYKLTDGTFNVVMGSVLQIWHEYRMADEGRLPSIEDLEAAATLTDMSYLIIDEDNSTVFLEKTGMAIDAGAIAKGFAVSLALDAAREIGMTSALLSAGGHVAVIGTPDNRESWNVGIMNPKAALPDEPPIVDSISITNTGVSIAGGYHRYFIVDGQSYGHIIDPETLFPPRRFSQVAVVHPIQWLADVLSTALYILPQEEGAELATQLEAEALWIDMNGNRHYTDGYREMSSVLLSG